MKYRIPFKTIGDLWGATENRPHPHRGVDFPVPKGSPIKAVADGTITWITHTDVLGNMVVLLDTDGYYWGFCHLDTIGKIKQGQRIRKGYVIGTVGMTGTAATGPHLHLTCSKDSHGIIVGLTLDPLKILKGTK